MCLSRSHITGAKANRILEPFVVLFYYCLDGAHLRRAEFVIHQLLAQVEIRLGARLAAAPRRRLVLVIEDAPGCRINWS